MAGMEMNAYELADWLDRSRDAYEPNGWSADMLRQQADRIAELERLVSDMIYEKSSGVYQGKYLEQYWVKQQSVEPVAWWTGKFEDESEDFMFAKTRQAHIDHAQSCTHEFFPIPLYTTPQIKELSDEEIIEIRQNTKASSTNNWADSLAFARAILKKASEK